MKESDITSDQEILKAVKNGNLDAYTTFVRRYEKQIASTVIGMLGDCPEAEDVGQETFIRFYKSLDNFRGDARPATYLTRIAINLSLNELKRRKRHHSRHAPLEQARQTAANSKSEETLDLKENIHRAIQSLDPKYRSVIVLRLVDGYSTRETANILKLPTGTVLSRLARAQAKLRNVLSSIWEENHG